MPSHFLRRGACLVASVWFAACSPDLVDTDCLTDADCLVGTCAENASGDRVCVPDLVADGGTDAQAADTGSPDTSPGDAVSPDTIGTPDATVDATPDAPTPDVPITEQCDNAIDDDGDGQVDCGDADCTEDPACLCGNQRIDEGEDCDGGALDGETCASLGFAGGELFCSADCTYRTSECGVGAPLVQQHDDWVPGDPLRPSDAFGLNDAAVSCFETPSDDITYALVSVQVLIAGDGTGELEAEFEVLVWNDGGDGVRPTDLIHEERVLLGEQPRALQQVSLAEQRVQVRDRYCIGIEQIDLFGPSVGVDEGVDSPRDQWLRRFGAFDPFWEPIATFSRGDWVLRAALLPVTQ